MKRRLNSSDADDETSPAGDQQKRIIKRARTFSHQSIRSGSQVQSTHHVAISQVIPLPAPAGSIANAFTPQPNPVSNVLISSLALRIPPLNTPSFLLSTPDLGENVKTSTPMLCIGGMKSSLDPESSLTMVDSQRLEGSGQGFDTGILDSMLDPGHDPDVSKDSEIDQLDPSPSVNALIRRQSSTAASRSTAVIRSDSQPLRFTIARARTARSASSRQLGPPPSAAAQRRRRTRTTTSDYRSQNPFVDPADDSSPAAFSDLLHGIGSLNVRSRAESRSPNLAFVGEDLGLDDEDIAQELSYDRAMIASSPVAGATSVASIVGKKRRSEELAESVDGQGDPQTPDARRQKTRLLQENDS